MQGHLQLLIRILIMHIMDYIQGIDIQTRQPLHHVIILAHYIIIIQIISLDRTVLGTYLNLEALIHAAVDCVQQALGQIGACAEELHLLADSH